MAISDWPSDERPRERLLRDGPAGLSDAELLAIFLRMGVRGKSAVDLARDLLAAFAGDLNRLCDAPTSELAAVSGIGPAKAAQLKAVFALSGRALAQRLKERDVLGSPEAVRDFLRLRFAQKPHEVFAILLLDARNRLIEMHELFRGTLSQTAVYPREVARLVLEKNAAAVILAHNHPSGVAEPSTADLALTQLLKDTLALLDVRVLDHFIVAGNNAPLSLAERGLV
jgi:DNA repair protein RadC